MGVNKLLGIIDTFLTRAKNENVPFQAFLKTATYNRMEKAITAALQKQTEWLIDYIQGIDSNILPSGAEQITDDQLAKLAQLIENNQPGLDEYLDQNDLAKWYKVAFEASVKAQYERWGAIAKAESLQVFFKLENPFYLAALNSQANYLLRKSKITQTGREQAIKIIQEGKLNFLTVDEIAAELTDKLTEVNKYRGWMIARTELNNAMNTGQKGALVQNNVPTKAWIPAGPSTCAICQGNADQGFIGVNDPFDSGDDTPPGHPNCECYMDGGKIDLDTIDLWDGS